MSPRWRRWAIPGTYLAFVATAALMPGGLEPIFAVYRCALPWSVFSFGIPNVIIAWAILGLGVALNALLCLYIGYHLDERAQAPDAAA